ncbi:MAG: type IV secretory system conjugative DNA transfer family protein [Pseudomonadota bacterium]|nr:type IV secretory system conjugative DNA transfer family protein [Pseudomonadota bacterium]
MFRNPRKINKIWALLIAFAVAGPAWADTGPVPLDDLKALRAEEVDQAVKVGVEIRRDALREAALSLGARGGLANRTYEIRQEIAKFEGVLDRVFDFRGLLIAAPSGLLMEPPVIGESRDALAVEVTGQAAALADRIYEIGKVARIVTTPRDWRAYLEREWSRVDPPPGLLRPKTDEEAVEWSEWIEAGWKAGVAQATDIFQADMDRLSRDFTGMIRYRMLLAQGMVSAPFADSMALGITGGGRQMRINEKMVRITGSSVLDTEASRWNPADR